MGDQVATWGGVGPQDVLTVASDGSRPPSQGTISLGVTSARLAGIRGYFVRSMDDGDYVKSSRSRGTSTVPIFQLVFWVKHGSGFSEVGIWVFISYTYTVGSLSGTRNIKTSPKEMDSVPVYLLVWYKEPKNFPQRNGLRTSSSVVISLIVFMYLIPPPFYHDISYLIELQPFFIGPDLHSQVYLIYSWFKENVIYFLYSIQSTDAMCN